MAKKDFCWYSCCPLLVRKVALSKADYLVSGFLLKILSILLYLDF